MFTLKTYKSDHLKMKNKPAFFIQSKGNNAGQPLKEPKPNCFSVWTENEGLYMLVYTMFVRKLFYPFLRGSVVPFICINEVKVLINAHAGQLEYKNFVDKAVKAFNAIEKLERVQIEQKKTLAHYKNAIAHDLLTNKA